MYSTKQVGSLVKGYMTYNTRVSNHVKVEVELNSGYTHTKALCVTSATNEVTHEVSTSGLVYVRTYEFNEYGSSERYYILNKEDFSFEVLVAKYVYHYE